MEAMLAYIARDRWEAMAAGEELRGHTRGTALFADISGFTPLTEALTCALGPRRGVEELTGHLNRVYDALVQEVDAQRGSIIHFAGDAVTCWFDGDSGVRAVACGLAMQAAMARQPVVEAGSGRPVVLSLKVGVAEGDVRRFAVGEPSIQLLDVLAGATLAEMAVAANLAGKGEVVLASPLAAALGDQIERAPLSVRGGESGGMVGVAGLRTPAPVLGWPTREAVPDRVLQPWVLPAVFERMQTGRGEFLTELRPAVALFLKFGGIDYDGDAGAGHKLDAFVRWIQRVVSSFGGFLHHVSVGDKGSYLYGTFGAPIAHEDDAVRALAAALELRMPPADLGFSPQPRIGISQGTLRTGAYGGATRRTYGVLGDEVNLAARLMDHAAAGEVLVSGRTQEAGGEPFAWESVPPVKLKGKAQPVAVFRLVGRRADEGMRLLQLVHTLPMVGRVGELAKIGELLDRARTGRGQMVEILGDAGMGKTRLVAEAVRFARERGFEILGGQAQSFGTNTAYLVWWPIWRSFFDLEKDATLEIQAALLGASLLATNSSLLPRLPLLGNVLNLPLPDNDTTRQLDGKLRKAALESLLAECLRHRSARGPVLIVLEDGQWLDPLSRDLAAAVARSVQSLRVVLLVATRPPDEGGWGDGGPRLLPYFTNIPLTELGAVEAEQLIRLKLAQSARGEATPDAGVVRRLAERSQGNPFYLEELINLVRDQGLDPNEAQTWESLELPASLQSLILSRMDRLNERLKPTLKVASVIGRVFEPFTISAIQPSISESEVAGNLTELERLELTAMERPEPQLAFIFKHVVTQEVAYDTLSFATRERLHGDLGMFLERRHAGVVDRHLDLLAFHFDRSGMEGKRREYLLRAAAAAQGRYANAAAINYYRRVLPLLPEGERIQPQISLGKVLETTGDWPEAADTYRGALALAEQLTDRPAQARARTALADLQRKQGAYAEATRELDLARTIFADEGDASGVAVTLHYAGSVAAQQGAYEKARALYRESLETRREVGDQAGVASLLSNLGIIAWFQGDFPTARALYEESLALRRQLGDRWAIANSLNNLGLVVRDLGDVAEARRLLVECLGINREIDDRCSIANSLGSLADIALSQRDHAAAREFLVENTALNRELGDRTGLAFSLELFAQLLAGEADAARALQLAAAAGALRESIGAPLSPSEQERLDRMLEDGCSGIPAAERAELVARGRVLPLEAAIALALAPAHQAAA